MTDRVEPPTVLALPAPRDAPSVALPVEPPAAPARDPCESTDEILPPAPERASPGSRLVCFLAALALGALALWIGGALLPASVEGVRALSWPETEAVLLHAALGHEVDFGSSSLDDGGDHLWLELRYAYVAPSPDLPAVERPYTGTRFDASTSGDDGRQHEASPARRAYYGHAVAVAPRLRVRYDPQRPERALVLPGLPYGLLGGWLAVMTLLLAVRPLLLHGLRHGARATFGGGRRTVGHGERTAAEVCGALVYAFLTFALWATWGIGWGAWMPGAPPVLPVLLALVYGAAHALLGGAVPARVANVASGTFGIVLSVAALAATAAMFRGDPGGLSWEPTDDVRRAHLVSSHRDVRLAAIRAFGRDGRPDGAEDVVRALTLDPDPAIRRAADLALSRRR